MANPEQLDILQQGTKTWNTWRTQHPEAGIDLSAADLWGADLSEVNLRGADLSYANLRGVNLNEANLSDNL